ncbi:MULTISPECIES: antibiotic biosynthesis monooxygenase [unclassified Streptomyces]|uniref:antibiotic biosynthesis monooxygenase n=1 Tax=unclassified Streptomyces TaxID=2593676 RepID=UPI002DD98719|nr:antibiotic biosynthesis monooxygenase [Streptomyces sp. NBC_01257]WRZ64147.1 antibiotic biosynthesis monooxygenase [Streptomyces sp. NBC_01257]WSU58110.1 antibiotic biosynthesis monooxygenase [Streptomyces sp. NBC_01104]
MTVEFVSRPDVTRADAGIARAGTWDAGTPERRRRTVEAIRSAWADRPWPHPGLLSYSVHVGEDDRTLFHYAQWTGEESYRDFANSGGDGRDAEVDAAVPGIERHAPHTYELYRSSSPGGREPGCVVVVDVEFDGADRARQRDWVDGVFEALGTDPALPPGGIAAHFHVGTDGTRVLNYAEWESAQAHVDALAGPGDGVGSRTPQWQRVQTYPGVTGGGVHRYTPALSLRPGQGA